MPVPTVSMLNGRTLVEYENTHFMLEGELKHVSVLDIAELCLQQKDAIICYLTLSDGYETGFEYKPEELHALLAKED